jgi:excisionase family DNA binding protein
VAGPSYSDLLTNLEGALDGLSPSDCAQALGDLERLKAILWHRMVAVSCGTTSSQPRAEGMLLTLPQVAKLLAVPTGHAYELARRDVLPVVRFGKYVRVPHDSLTRWIGQQTTPERRIDNGHLGFHSGTVTPNPPTRMLAKARPEPGQRQREKKRPVRSQPRSEPNRLSQVKSAVGVAAVNEPIPEGSE